ncbi:MAG TPA: hypothetical protein PKI46_04560 [Bacteroidales bacterium]|nr:hypothetical protein [Bacteroidales bacterium]
MYLSGYVINMNYLEDNSKLAVIKPYSIGLSLLSIASIRGGTIKKDLTHSSTYFPLSMRVDDSGNKFYDLKEGSYQIIFNQGLKKLPKDHIASISNNDISKIMGAFLVPDRYFEYTSKGNISAILIVPSNSFISIEVGSHIADLIITQEKFLDN